MRVGRWEETTSVRLLAGVLECYLHVDGVDDEEGDGVGMWSFGEWRGRARRRRGDDGLAFGPCSSSSLSLSLSLSLLRKTQTLRLPHTTPILNSPATTAFNVPVRENQQRPERERGADEERASDFRRARVRARAPLSAPEQWTTFTCACTSASTKSSSRWSSARMAR